MVNEQFIADLLHNHGLKNTPIRAEMLVIFMNHDFALSANDIIEKMRPGKDRVTIYRALSSFEEHGILHKASKDAHGIKYALCSHECPDQPHSEAHAHFICNECHQTFCLTDVAVPKATVSEEFFVDKIDYTLGGLCKDCNTHA